MNRLLILPLIAFLAISYCVSGQNVFNVAYDNYINYEAGRSIVHTQDGGYVSFGRTGMASTPFDSVLFLKQSASGQIEWQLFLDIRINGSPDMPRSIIELADGSLLACGYALRVGGSDFDGFLVKITAHGQFVWLRTYGTTGSDQRIEQVKQTSDGGFILAGFYQTPTSNYNAWLIKTDSLGFEEWQQQYSPTISQNIFSIDLTRDGGYILAGRGTVAGLSAQMVLIKIDSIGNQQWYNHYGGAGFDHGQGMIATYDGGYLITGVKNEDEGYAVKTDSAGNEEWNYYIPVANYNLLQRPLQLQDSSYIIIGSANTIATQWDGSLTKLTPQGNLIWERTYRYHPGATGDYFYGLTLCTDSGFAMTGMIINNDLPQKNDMWILKTDACGNTVGDTLNPQATMSFSNGAGVNNNTYSFTNLSTDHCWQIWYFGDGDSTLAANPQHTYQQPGTYTVMLVAFAGAYSDTVTQQVTVHPCGAVPGDTLLPTAAMLVSPGPQNGAYSFTSQSTEYCNLLWYFGDGDTSTTANPQHIYQQSGTYEVMHIAFAGLEADTVTEQISVLVGMQEGPKTVPLQLYPNPNSGDFTITFDAQAKQGQLQVYDVLGQVVHTEVISPWSTEKRLSQPELAQGLYHCRISWGEKTGVVRFVKE